MMLRTARFSTPRLRAWLVSALLALPAFASCTSSEDTEPFVPARSGAIQPDGEGELIDEDKACERVQSAEDEARDRLGCSSSKLDCPSRLRPAGGSGCYQYREASVSDCEDAYADATSCAGLFPCIVTAELKESLPTCEVLDPGTGGAGGAAGASGAAGVGGAGAGAGGAATGGAGLGGSAGAETAGAGAGGVAGGGAGGASGAAGDAGSGGI